MRSAMRYSHILLTEALSEGGVAVDATMGNGNDTLFLSQLLEDQGQVFAFDIQEQALQNTREKLTENQAPENTTLYRLGHEKMEEVLPEDIQIQAAIFNLGYLPKSDKKIITLPETTLKAFEFILNHLAVGGRLVCVLYYGHEGGEEEKNAVLSYAAKLPQQQYQVLTYQFINQIHCPPICLCIEKIKEEH